MIGQTISHYKILEKLGEGGMGVVYKAQDTTLDRLVALKFLPPHLSASDEDKARFVQEAKAAAALNHPNICTIHGIEDSEGQTFIVMEFVEGQTLRDKTVGRIADSPIQLKQALEIGIQIADGLAAAHEKGIVHRDLKPENIMLQKDGRLRIMDFGLAKLKGASRLTKAGSTVGTTGYMSPEQVQGFDTDHRTDIFSLGVLLYELFAGQSPFKGVHETAVNYEIVNVDPDPISTIKPEIDPELDSIILDCLAKDLKERCQSVAEVARDLRRFKRESSKQRLSRITAAREAYRPSQMGTTGSEIAPAIPEKKSVFVGINVSWIVAGIFLLLATLVAFIHFTETIPEVRVYQSTILPPEKTNFVMSFGGHVALSPDGRLLAFPARDSSGKTLLWVRPLNSISGQALNGTDDASFPFWSPDSRFIGFFAGGKLKKIEASGGPPQTICDAPIGRGGTWGLDGTIVFSPNSQPGNSIYRVSAAGGAPALLTKLDSSRGEMHHRWPHFLPDGMHFLYLARTVAGGVGEEDAIVLASLDSTVKHRSLMNASSSLAYANGHLLFLREQTLMARPFDAKRLEFTGDAFPIAEQVHFEAFTSKASFTVSDNGTLAYQTGAGSAGVRLTWYDRSGKLLGSTGQPSVYHDMRISPDGKRVAVSQLNAKIRNTDIWLSEIGREVWTRFTFDAAEERFPIWSPDGSTIVFSSFRKRWSDLYQRNASGAGSEELLYESNLWKRPSDWSRDGKFLAFHAEDPTTYNDIWILPMDSKRAGEERKPFVFLQTEFQEVRAAFSPDGRWIAYQSNESGRDEIYLRPFLDPDVKPISTSRDVRSGRWQVSTNGGTHARWRRDGKELFYLGSDDKIMAVEIKLGSTTVDVGAVRPLFQISPFRGASRDLYDVTTDGQRFLVATPGGEEISSPITLVVNWNAELKKK
jgi:serine/threonine protein kinase